jgi:4'-phosphopantetheinyl transferase
MTLFPVIMPVAKAGRKLTGEEKVTNLSRVAREALRLSSQKSGLELGELPKDQKGMPCPAGGTYWSLSHKSRYVAAVVSRSNVGIDIEEVKPRPESLSVRVAGDDEWRLLDSSLNTLYRYWTAKEAVLKVIGIGIGGLRTCRVISVPDEYHITLDYHGQSFLVEHLLHKDHIVSVLKDNNRVEWVIV